MRISDISDIKRFFGSARLTMSSLSGIHSTPMDIEELLLLPVEVSKAFWQCFSVFGRFVNNWFFGCLPVAHRDQDYVAAATQRNPKPFSSLMSLLNLEGRTAVWSQIFDRTTR